MAVYMGIFSRQPCIHNSFQMRNTLRSNNYNLSCTGSIWAGKLHSLDWIHLCYNYAITEQNVAFLVPDSCRATQRNDMRIRADVTDAAFQNVQNDTSFSYFQTIWQLFWTFWYCWKITICLHCRKYKINWENALFSKCF